MKKACKKITTTWLFAFALALGIQVDTASAEEYTIGAQVCTYVTFSQADLLAYSSTGIINNDTRPLWVICPVAVQVYAGNVDVIARITNRSDVRDTVECVYYVTNDVGNSKKAIPQSAPVAPNTRVSLATSNINFQTGDAFSVQCKLPPGFQAVSFTIET